MKRLLATCVMTAVCVPQCFAADTAQPPTKAKDKVEAPAAAVPSEKGAAKPAEAKEAAVKEAVVKEESWVGTFSKKDNENVEFTAGGKTFEVIGAIEKELVKEAGKEMKVTGTIDSDGALKVAKAEPVKVTK
jgi:hypothetical protein